jgi:hypothetical protein
MNLGFCWFNEQCKIMSPPEGRTKKRSHESFPLITVQIRYTRFGYHKYLIKSTRVRRSCSPSPRMRFSLRCFMEDRIRSSQISSADEQQVKEVTRPLGQQLITLIYIYHCLLLRHRFLSLTLEDVKVL